MACAARQASLSGSQWSPAHSTYTTGQPPWRAGRSLSDCTSPSAIATPSHLRTAAIPAPRSALTLAYESDGKPLDKESDGDLRLGVISQKNNQVVDGHWAVKWINKIEIRSVAEEWNLTVKGAITDVVDRGSFESCSAPSCHGRSWRDESGQEWTGTPLYYIVGRGDDAIKHDVPAFNQMLAEKGYKVEVVAADGYKVTLDSQRLNHDPNIILAY